MKFDCGPTWKVHLGYLENWHRKFAWVPVQVGSHDCRWLEYVERRGEVFPRCHGAGGLAVGAPRDRRRPVKTVALIVLAAAALAVAGLCVFLYWLFQEDFSGDHRHE